MLLTVEEKVSGNWSLLQKVREYNPYFVKSFLISDFTQIHRKIITNYVNYSLQMNLICPMWSLFTGI